MVSIVIPTYNYASYLKETLNSVLRQSHTDWECIVVDDGSTDATADVVNEFTKKDKRFIYVYQKNAGVSAARNKGLSLAKGEYIQFLDGDDLLQPEKIETGLAAFRNHADAEIVYSDVRFFDDGREAELRTSLNGTKPDNWLPRLNDRGAKVVAILSSINFMVIHAPLLRRSLFERVGLFDVSMKALEDWDFWMRCALENAFFCYAAHDNAMALVRVHEGSLSKEKTYMLKGNFLFLKRTLAHRNISAKFALILVMKYVELFWDSVFRYGYVSAESFLLSGCAFFCFPLYLILKLVRLFR